MAGLFGTDGIRGVAGTPPLVPPTIRRIGSAIALTCRTSARTSPLIIIGRDTRASGPSIELDLIAGISSAGGTAMPVGVVPTPAVAFLTPKVGASAGIVISASHNPWQDNGIKVFSRSGTKISDSMQSKIEDLLSAPSRAKVRGKSRSASPPFDPSRAYADFCISTWPRRLTLRGIRLVLDCANGATSHVAPAVFTTLRADVVVINNQPDGRNINNQCGSEHIESLVDKVRQTGADVGLAFDGDGDRLVAVDHHGNVLSGDHILAVSAAAMKKERRLRRNRVVFTSMSNMGLRAALDKMNIRWSESDVGDRFVLEEMHRTGACLGGEQSGHIIFSDLHSTGDGIIAGLQLLAVVAKSGQRLADLANIMKVFPQILINVETLSKPSLDSLPRVQSAIRNARSVLGRNGRAFVRYSGTQSLCRVMVEGRTLSIAERIARNIADAISTDIGKTR